MANKSKQHRNQGKSRSVPLNTFKLSGTERIVINRDYPNQIRIKLINSARSKYTPHIEDEKHHLKEFNEV